MLTVAEIDLLNEFIGPEGCFYQAIIEHPGFTLGCKIIFLKRAITLNCAAFLNCLDTLYHHKNTDTLNFIRPLKHLNDMCFNNIIKVGNFGTKLTLDHFFGPINSNINPLLFQEFIVNTINQNIESLQNQQNPTTLKAELCNQIFKEDHVIFNSRWRHKEGLPLAQLSRKEEHMRCPLQEIADLSLNKMEELKHPIIQNLLYFQILSHEEFKLLSEAQYLILTDIAINQILLATNVQIEERLMIREEAQLQNIIDVYMNQLPPGELSFTEILNLNDRQCRLVGQFISFREMGLTDIALRELLNLNPNQIENLCHPPIQFLIMGEVLNFEEVINITPQQRQRILSGNCSEVINEIKYPSQFSSCCTMS